MASTWLMWLLIVEYALIALSAIWERNYLRALYYFGAICISVSILGLSAKGKG